MKDKTKNILIKQFQFEDCILILVGVVALTFGVLIYAKVINPDAYSNNSFSIILILMGLVAIITGINGIIKKRKYKNSIFYQLINDYNNNLIEEKLKKHGLNYEKVNVEVDKNSVEISVDAKSGVFTLICFKNNLIYSFDKEDENELNTSAGEVLEEYDTLKTTLDEMYLKFSYLANQYKNK